MKRIVIRSFGKINLSLDVLEKLDSGYHRVEMVMQQIQLHDQVLVRWFSDRQTRERIKQNPITQEPKTPEPIKIEVSTNKPYIPVDEKNLAYKAALIMAQQFGEKKQGKIRIDIKKQIPVAAGLAGGSSNGAAVLHAINRLWDLNLSMQQLCELAGQLGSDVPFCVLGQAKANIHLNLSEDPMATHCALATGTGDQLQPIPGVNSYLVLTKPPISISTREAYQGLDLSNIEQRPNTAELIQGLTEKNFDMVTGNMVNVLESYTLKKNPIVLHTKNDVQEILKDRPVLMSGSGPTIYALCQSQGEVKKAFYKLKRKNKATFWTETTY